ncbi:VOC family protein [soil metagenome]
MARMIYINLPVADIAATRRFFAKLGFEFNPMFSDEHTAAMVVEENIVVMMLDRSRFADFVTGEISDPSSATEVLLCLSAESREEVDTMLAAAFDAGATPWKDVMDDAPMYGGSLQDLDGHVWEVLHMDLAALEQST